MPIPAVAILIPTLDSERTLERCLRAVARLTWPRDDVDLIVADGGSRDGTIAIARAHGARIFARAGRDPFYLRNLAAGQTDALTLLFLDPDCEPPADWIPAALGHLAREEIAAVGVRPVPPHRLGATWVQRAWAAHCLARPADTPAAVLRARMLAVRRQEFLAAGGFIEAYGPFADCELLRRLAGPRELRRGLVALTRDDAVHLTACRGLRDFYRAERRLHEAPLSTGIRHGPERMDPTRALLPLYGLLATFYLLTSVLRPLLSHRPPGRDLWVALVLALGPSLLPALRVALRRRRPLLLAPLWFLYVIRQTARGAALR
jgi:glycosyltransferase involved in cell wall biosynthesis